MKKIIFALISAAAMASIPLNVNATNACEINIASGETMTINYDLNAAHESNNCHINNYGNLYIKSGASISAYDGYAVRNYGNTTMTGGFVESKIHQAVWVTSGSFTITGGQLASAGGYEENIYSTANGKIDICGNYSYASQGTVLKCGIAPAPTQPQTPATPAPASETVTITVTSSEKKTENTSTASAPVVKTPAPSRTIASAPVATAQTTTPATPVAEAPKKEAPVAEKKIEKKTPAVKEEAESLPTAGVTLTNDENNVFIVALTASLILLGTASVAIITSRIRA